MKRVHFFHFWDKYAKEVEYARELEQNADTPNDDDQLN